MDSIGKLALSRMENGDITLIALDDELVERVARELGLEAVASEVRR